MMEFSGWYVDMLHQRNDHPDLASWRERADEIDHEYGELTAEHHGHRVRAVSNEFLRHIEPTSTYTKRLLVTTEDGDEYRGIRLTKNAAGGRGWGLRLQRSDGEPVEFGKRERLTITEVSK